jgi:hypothetical protein
MLKRACPLRQQCNVKCALDDLQPLRSPWQPCRSQDQQRCKLRLAGLLADHERQRRDYERVAQKERLKKEVRRCGVVVKLLCQVLVVTTCRWCVQQ